MVKLGRASEAARESAGEAGAATDALLAHYALTPAPATALRTPAAHPHQDRCAFICRISVSESKLLLFEILVFFLAK